MSFVYPSFLFALFSLLIPVIIHLINLRRYKKIYFSNVSLLQEIQTQSKKRRQLREWLILASRILALSFLVFAFAQPYIKTAPGAYRNDAPAYVSIYVDNSFSMEKPARNGNLLSEAMRRAEDIVKSYRAADRFQLLTNEFSGSSMRFMTRDEFLSALADVQAGPASRTLDEVMLKQQDQLGSKSEGGPRRAYLISDFATNTIGDVPSIRDTALVFAAIPVKPERNENLGIDSVWASSPVISPNIPVDLNFRIVNSAANDLSEVPVRLFLNGEQKTPASVSVAAGSKAVGQLSFSVPAGGRYHGYIEVDDASMHFDDRFYFSFSVAEKIRIGVLNGNGAGNAPAQVFEGDEQFDLKRFRGDRPDFSAWNGLDLLVLNQVSDLSTGWATELNRFLEDGGSVVFFPSAENSAASADLLRSIKVAGFSGGLRTNTLKGGKLAVQSPFFSNVFENRDREITDVPVVKQYFPLQNRSGNIWEPLFILPNGDVVIAWCNSGKGHVLVSGLPLQSAYSNLTAHAVFVPLLLKSAFNARGTGNLYYTAGSATPVTVRLENAAGEGALDIKKTGESWEAIPGQRRNGNTVQLFLNDMAAPAGNYEIRENGTVVAPLAINFAPGEGLALPLVDEQWNGLLKEIPSLRKMDANNAAALAEGIQQLEQGIPLWKWCIAAVLLFLLAEILIIRFIR